MAVQKSKKSRSKRDMRRANLRIKSPTLSNDPFTGEVHTRHHVTEQGYYKGKQVIKIKEKADKEDA